MKYLAKAIILLILTFFARLVIRRYHPKVVMITGSVGKTSTKDATAAALGDSFYLRAPEKSYNSEFGVPLTILGAKNPWNNPLRWLAVFKDALVLLLLPNHYPNLLVLEVGADRPGDLAKILRIATPDAVIVTRLPEVPVHVEAYASPEALREEEFAPAYALAPEAPLIVASRDEHARRMAKRIPARMITYGFAEDSEVRVSRPGYLEEGGRVVGMRADLSTPEGEGELVVRGAAGMHQLVPAAAAVAAALSLGVSLETALASLASYTAPPGRGRIFNGMRGSIVIDDSYNASPAAVEEALKMLGTFPGARRRIAVLGDMLELGRYSVSEHERIGRLASESADIVVSVGVRSRSLVDAARLAGTPAEETYSFDDALTAAGALGEVLQEGDVVLVKGSQSVRTERIVEALLADPADRNNLVRQEREWKRR